MKILSRSLALLFLTFLLAVLPLQTAADSSFDHSYTKYAQLLSNYVVVKGPASNVKYKALKNSGELSPVLGEFSEVSKSQFDSFSKDQKLAFLINAYNAFTLKLIIDKYPVESIKDIGSVFSGPWKQEVVTLFGKAETLDHVEHTLIRPVFKEARVHFALVCAAKGCPRLLNDAYRAETLNAQLNDAAKVFLNDSAKNRFIEEENELVLSKIFDWFEDDFGDEEAVRAFAASHQKGLSENQALAANLEYSDYDWSLNDAG